MSSVAAREGSLAGSYAASSRLAGRVVLRRGGAHQGARARLRHLPRLPALLQPVQCLPHAVRCRRCIPHGRARWRRQEGLLGGRGSLLPVRHVLHDEVPVRSAASLERRLPASDAARESGARQERRHLSCAIACSPRPMPSAISPGIPVVVDVVNAVNRSTARPRAAREGRWACIARRRSAVSLAHRAQAPRRGQARRKAASRTPRSRRAARSRCSSRATATATSPSSMKTWSPCSSTTASRCKLVEQERCCGMPRLELGDLESVAKLQGIQHPAVASVRSRPATTSSRRSPRAC